MKRIVPSSVRKAGRASLSKERGRPQSRSFVSILTGEPAPSVPMKGGKAHPRLSGRRRDHGDDRRTGDLPADEPGREALRGEAPRMDDFLYNPVLLPTNAVVVTSAASVPQASALERAQAAALAERVLHSVQVGRIQGGHLVRLRLSSDVEIQLRHCDGVLQATVVGEGDQGSLARRLDAELRGRGLRFDRVELG